MIIEVEEASKSQKSGSQRSAISHFEFSIFEWETL